MTSLPRLSIVIPVFNCWNFTEACLRDLSPLPDDHEIVVVDNGSTDGTYHNLLRRTGGHVVHLSKNQGFAGGCNAGYKASTGRSVMFLNNDIRVKADAKAWTAPILEAAERGNLVSPTVGWLDRSFNFIGEAPDFSDKHLCYLSGWNLTARRDVLDRLVLPDHEGPFSTEFGLAYFEDTDLSFRAKELHITMQAVQVPVVHFGKVTSKKLNTLRLYQPAKKKFIEKWAKRR